MGPDFTPTGNRAQRRRQMSQVRRDMKRDPATLPYLWFIHCWACPKCANKAHEEGRGLEYPKVFAWNKIDEVCPVCGQHLELLSKQAVYNKKGARPTAPLKLTAEEIEKYIKQEAR